MCLCPQMKNDCNVSHLRTPLSQLERIHGHRIRPGGGLGNRTQDRPLRTAVLFHGCLPTDNLSGAIEPAPFSRSNTQASCHLESVDYRWAILRFSDQKVVNPQHMEHHVS